MIADILTELREKHGYTMKEVAEGIEVKPDTYRSYERGRLQPNLDVVVKLADFYNISADYLLGREPNPPAFLTQEETELEKRLVEQYFKLPEPYRKKFLEGVIQAVEMQKQENSTDTAQEDLGPLTQSATIGELLAASDDEAKNGA